MGLLRMAALGALGWFGYKKFQELQEGNAPAAFDEDQGDRNVRDAGPESMRDKPKEWSKTDEEMDETFPASDPPANY